MSQVLLLGVDMSKAKFAAAVRCGKANQALGEYTNDAHGRHELAERVQATGAEEGASQIHLIVEPTGGYETALVAYAHEKGWLVSLPNPKQVRDWAKGMGYRVKTDRVDARLLAHYGAERQPAAQPALAKEVTELDSLLKRRLDVEKMLHQEHTRLSELGERPGMAATVATSLQQVIDALEAAWQTLEEAIATLLQQQTKFQEQRRRLLLLPGIGNKNVLPLLVTLHRWQTLTNGQGEIKGLTAYVGLDPQPYESGRSVWQHPGISKMGNGELRRLLYMGALGGVRGDNPLKHFYQRLVGRGKAKKLALVAAARKILTWAWAIFSQEVDWNPNLHTS